jgi:hypothetical protein
MRQEPGAKTGPQIGDVARVKESGRLGTVVRLKGVRDQRCRLAMLPDATAPKVRDLWYGLDELEFPS